MMWMFISPSMDTWWHLASIKNGTEGIMGKKMSGLDCLSCAMDLVQGELNTGQSRFDVYSIFLSMWGGKMPRKILDSKRKIKKEKR